MRRVRVTDAWVAAATAVLQEVIAGAPAARTCRIALAGGETPRPWYQALARTPLPYDRLELFWGDERVVPPDHPDSNAGWARRLWLDHVPLDPARIHPWPTEKEPTDAARAYADTLRRAFGDVDLPRFDLVVLGLGSEGHTASLFPGSPALAAHTWTVAVPVPGRGVRLSLTLPVLSAARRILFLVTGEAKREAVRRTLSPRPHEPTTVAALIRAENVDWVLDPAAAQDLPPGLGARP
ncbi:MAG: 6-phosphogluconolactonase [Actinomycetia bacterium]|nr:6-phosphogluconolactonase [Actinomycetes bacterium]